VSRLWPIVRRVWIAAGLTAAAGFVLWSLVAYRANAEGRAAARPDSTVSVERAEGIWRFQPRTVRESAVLVFFPGGLVDPRAYAPLARSAAQGGHDVLVIELPRRGAFGGADSPELHQRIARALSSIHEDRPVVVGGHSRGAVVASTYAANAPRLAGVVLIGTSHPRDMDLSGLAVPVTKIVGTRDGLATPDEVDRNAHLLPAHTRWVWLEGGNHSQFGWYGFQPMDRRPRIAAAEQRAVMNREVLDLLHAVGRATLRAESTSNLEDDSH